VKFNPQIRRQHRSQSQAGYLLLTIMLMVVLMTIAALAVAPEITQQVKRDRENELIYRGVQYARGVKRYFKKFGRYPTRLEDLENTNNMRFLRRRYKDPITGKDFKLVHFGEVQVFPVNNVGTPAGQAGQNAAPPGMAGAAALQNAGLNGPPPGQQGNTSQQDQGTDPGQPGTPVAQMPGATSNDNQSQVFGGGAIIGVASTSNKEGIHEFNKKKKYSEWQFVFDPNLDRGGLITGPAQPPIAGVGGTVQGQPGPPGQNSPGGFSIQPGGGIQNPGGMQPPGMQPQSNFPPDTRPQ
jgi:type II secretory pathway pseudopilin PulG